MRKNSMHLMNIWRAYKLLTVGTLWNLETHNQLSLTTFTAFSGEFTRFVSFYYVLQVNLWSPCLRNFVNMPLLKVVLTASTRNPPSPISPLISPCRTRLWWSRGKSLHPSRVYWPADWQGSSGSSGSDSMLWDPGRMRNLIQWQPCLQKNVTALHVASHTEEEEVFSVLFSSLCLSLSRSLSFNCMSVWSAASFRILPIILLLAKLDCFNISQHAMSGGIWLILRCALFSLHSTSLVDLSRLSQ